ncbi:MAG TPA: ferritin-like domain-containing protein [Bryobacteraceae bacterium]|nr:ferritin-like domain-containing protein [Bryobacteraceae bacterium]HXJ38158.1 ferritin-like domain-containing protein [Bryobacteraceae bacterium]
MKLIARGLNANRRWFMKNALACAGAAGAGTRLLADDHNDDNNHGRLSKGDAALLRFAAAAEILESDFWIQYNELGGIQDSEVPGGSGIPAYTAALKNLDGDFDQYIHDNTDDEITHFTFLNAYLMSKGAAPADLEQFRTLPGSTATGSSGKPRLTNLMQLTLDTSWWTRYRSSANNPDLDPNFVFPQAVPGLASGQFTAIPRTNADLSPADHLQAIANTAAFHMPTIEQGGNSLYPSMAQRASSVEVLRILLSIGPTETMHFQTWSDKAGNAVSDPLAPLTDSTNGLTFPNLNAAPFGGETFQTNLIMPEPCPFLSRSLPVCSIIRPTETKGVAMGVVQFLTAMGLFIGQPNTFFELLQDLAAEADKAKRKSGDD